MSKSPHDRLRELLDPENFLGSGLTTREWSELHDLEKLAAAFEVQSRDERRRRLEAVMRLSVELARIREINIGSTRLAEMAIECVIGGDWSMVAEWAEHFGNERYVDDHTSESGVERWAVFRELLLQTLRSRGSDPA